MKSTSLFFLSLFGLCTSSFALKPGDAVKADALGTTEAIKGELTKEWEPGKVYILECWATWCGPCIVAIPHIDGLYDKYAEKGLRVIGLNVWEEDKNAAAEFVKAKGDGMSYPITHVKMDSAFQKEWLEAAGVTGIPHAFVVKDGKFLFSMHPMQLDEALVEDLLAGGERTDKAVNSQVMAKENEGKLESILNAFAQAVEKKDVATMKAKVAEVEAINPDQDFLPLLRMEIAISEESYDSVLKHTESVGKEHLPRVLLSLAGRVLQDPAASKMPVKFKQDIIARLKAVTDDKEQSAFMLRLQTAQLQWSLDDKAGALETAKLMAANPGELPQEPLTRFVKSIEDGKIATHEELFNWFQESQTKE